MTTHHTHQNKRLGFMLRRVAAWAGRQQGRFIKWQVSKGMPFKAAKLLVLLFNLAVIGVLVYLFAWVFVGIALLLALAVKLTDDKTMHTQNSNDLHPPHYSQFELRNGHAGFGTYTSHDVRIDNYNELDPE